MSARRLLALLALSPAWAAANHPLLTEDTGVLGRGVRQVELHGARSRDREEGVSARGVDASAVLSYGIAEKADLQIELPYIREEAEGEVVRGRGDASLSLKWRFFESDRLSLVAKPDLHFATGRDELGLGAGRTRWSLNLVGGYQVGRLELLGHAGYTKNRNTLGERTSLNHASVAGLVSATEKLRLVLDIGRDTNPDRASHASIREAVIGLSYALSRDIDLGLGLKKGLSDPADDRALLAGAKLRF